MNLVDNGSMRRLVALMLAPAFTVVNKKFGLNLGEAEVDAVLALVGVYIMQSAWKEQAMAKVEAAKSAPVEAKTPEAAKANLDALIAAEKAHANTVKENK